MLGVNCYRGGHSLCDMWPLCDCDCHAEKKLEAHLLQMPTEETVRVHERMMARRYSREWRRIQRGTDPLFKNQKTRRSPRCPDCGEMHDGEFNRCDECLERLRERRTAKKLAA